MFLSTSNPVGEFTSPFGTRFYIPAGQVTELPVEKAYWFVGQPTVDISFSSDEEEAECLRLNELTKHNPIKGIPEPQSLNPNATLQLDGHSAKYPVIVVNPQGLLSEVPQPFTFGPPTLNLVFDKEMIRQVLLEIHDAVQGIDAPDEPDSTLPFNPEIPPLPSEWADTLKKDEHPSDEYQKLLDQLDEPEPVEETLPTPPAPTFAEGEDYSDEKAETITPQKSGGIDDSEI